MWSILGVIEGGASDTKIRGKKSLPCLFEFKFKFNKKTLKMSLGTEEDGFHWVQTIALSLKESAQDELRDWVSRGAVLPQIIGFCGNSCSTVVYLFFCRSFRSKEK